MRKRHLGSIRAPAEHGLAEKHLPQRHAVQAADQLVVLPGLDTVRVTQAVQRAIGAAMPGVIQVPLAPGRGAAQAATTASKAVSKLTR